MRNFLFGCLVFVSMVGCSQYEVTDPVTGAVTVTSAGAEIGTAAYEAAKEAIPANPLDLTGWLGALGAAALAAATVGARVYMKRKKAA